MSAKTVKADEETLAATSDFLPSGHTPAEASELWCPFAKFDNINAFVVAPAHRAFQKVTRDGNEQIIGGQNCISSKCAAWRWAGNERERGWCGLTS